jgi:hypothetical protein
MSPALVPIVTVPGSSAGGLLGGFFAFFAAGTPESE